MKALDYTVFFEPIDKGGYMAIVPALPSIITYGKDLDEARAMVADAIKCHCEGLIRDREELPKDIQTKAEPIKERISITVGYA